MKSPEDRINDDLRDALRRRFDDFELTPEPALKHSIFAKLKTWQQDQVFQRTWITCLLFAILFTATLFYSSTRESVGKGVTVANSSIKNAADLKKAHLKKTVKKIFKNEQADFDKKTLNILNQEANVSENIKKGSAKIQDKTVEAIQAGELNLETSFNFSQSKPEKIDLNSQLTNDLYTKKESQADALIAPDSASERVEVENINNLNNRQATFEHPNLTITDSIRYYSKDVENSKKASGGFTLLLGVTPVKTFQILNIISNPGLMYRNFEFPGSASVETLGYKLSGGLEKNGFQLLLSYGQYRQAVRYEAAGNEFEVVPNGSNAEVKRKFTSIHSEQTLKLAGLGLRKQFVPRSPAFRDFYAVAGAEFTREISHGKNMVWANAGIGRQFGITRNAALQIGPYFEYGFTKLMNAEGSFQVQPYQVGLSIVLRNKLIR